MRGGGEAGWWSMNHLGPMCRSVADVALLLSAIAGYDPRDSTSVEAPIPNYTAALRAKVSALRLGVPRASSTIARPGDRSGDKHSAGTASQTDGRRSEKSACRRSQTRWRRTSSSLKTTRFTHPTSRRRRALSRRDQAQSPARLGSGDAAAYIQSRRELDESRRTIGPYSPDVDLLVTRRRRCRRLPSKRRCVSGRIGDEPQHGPSMSTVSRRSLFRADSPAQGCRSVCRSAGHASGRRGCWRSRTLTSTPQTGTQGGPTFLASSVEMLSRLLCSCVAGAGFVAGFRAANTGSRAGTQSHFCERYQRSVNGASSAADRRHRRTAGRIPAYDRAAQWAAARFREAGLTNVRFEGFYVAEWLATWPGTRAILAPVTRSLRVGSVGWGPSTPPGAFAVT